LIICVIDLAGHVTGARALIGWRLKGLNRRQFSASFVFVT